LPIPKLLEDAGVPVENIYLFGYVTVKCGKTTTLKAPLAGEGF